MNAMTKAIVWSCFLCLTSLLVSSGKAGAQSGVARDSTLDLESMVIEAGKEKLLGNRQKAKSLYELILEKKPDHALAAYELARLAIQSEDYSGAIKYAEQAALKEPQNIWYQRLWADSYIAIGRFREAAGVYEALARKFPADQPYYFQWASLLEKAGQYAAAIKVYDEMESRFGLQERITRLKVALFLLEGDSKKAGKELERFSEAFPRNLAGLHQLADFYLEQNDGVRAVQTYQRILALDPQDPKALAAMAGNGPATGSDPEGMLSLQELIRNQNIEVGLKAEKFKPLLDKLALEKTPSLAEKLLLLTAQMEQVHPGAAVSYALSGEVLFLSGKLKEASEKFLRALELDETRYEVWARLLSLYAESGDCKLLTRHAATALDIFPNRPFLYYLQALGAYRMGNYSSAQKDLEQALLMTTSEPKLRTEVFSALGLVLTAQEDPSGADRAFGEAAKIQADDPLLLARKAFSMAERNQDLVQAAELARRALPSPSAAKEAAQALGWVHFKRNELAEARKNLESLLPSNNPQVLEEFGDILFKQGQITEGLGYWNQAKEQGGRSPRLLKKITDKQLYE